MKASQLAQWAMQNGKVPTPNGDRYMQIHHLEGSEMHPVMNFLQLLFLMAYEVPLLWRHRKELPEGLSFWNMLWNMGVPDIELSFSLHREKPKDWYVPHTGHFHHTMNWETGERRDYMVLDSGEEVPLDMDDGYTSYSFPLASLRSWRWNKRHLFKFIWDEEGRQDVHIDGDLTDRQDRLVTEGDKEGVV